MSTEDARAFDRWLAEHDRQVAEKAWDEGNVSGIAFQAGGAWIDNPYWWRP